jgi:undecaprenyl-diphosphatase
MSTLEAIILGIIQGLTEFLPVSSSGHLFLGEALLQSEIEEPLLFTIVVHFATACSTILVFRKEIMGILSGLFKFQKNEETIYSWYIVLSMIPAVFVGLFLEDFLDALTHPNNRKVGFFVVGLCLLLTATLLYLTQKAKPKEGKITLKSAIIVGLSQALATLPGISRSGATIGTSLLLGVNRENAAKFSFLMVVPLIFGVMAKKGKDLIDEGFSEHVEYGYLIAGFLAAFISGWFACKWMINIVKKAKLNYFAVYCSIVGLVSIFFGFIY